MARIPEGEIERLKAEVSIERLAGARGIRLERRGADLLGLCPFHEDREPSLVITPAKNLWHCLGACRAGGSVIDWVMKCNGVSFRCGRAAADRSSFFSRPGAGGTEGHHSGGEA
jgi:DNA primase